jgi:hypothetical protein
MAPYTFYHFDQAEIRSNPISFLQESQGYIPDDEVRAFFPFMVI